MAEELPSLPSVQIVVLPVGYWYSRRGWVGLVIDRKAAFYVASRPGMWSRWSAMNQDTSRSDLQDSIVVLLCGETQHVIHVFIFRLPGSAGLLPRGDCLRPND